MVDATKIGEIDPDSFVAESRVYAHRLTAAVDGAEAQASEAAGNLVKAVFDYNAGLAIDVGEALCNHGVFSEAEMVLAIVNGAALNSTVDPGLATSVLTELLMPLSTDTPASVRDLLVSRSANPVETAERISWARELWSASDGRKSDVSAESGPSSGASAESGAVSLIQPPTMLGQMRTVEAAEVTAQEVERWSRAVAAFDGVAPRVVGIELLNEAERLELDPTTVARLAGVAARAGAVEEARAALSRILARTKAYAWMRHYDGGSRAALFEAAIEKAGVELVDFAARDLAGLVASRAIGGDFRPSDLRRFAELFGGEELVGQCWSEVRAYLDVFAPAADELSELVDRTPRAPEVEVLEWVARQLGHPVRIMDFGARRVLAAAHEAHGSVVEEVLAEVLEGGGWAAEAALHVLIEVRKRPGLGRDEKLRSALVEMASDKDAVIRVLSRRLLSLENLEAPALTSKDLPAFYDLELPRLPERSIPELDRYGVPFVDMTDPQQVIGPFDQHLDAVAEEIGLDAATLVHRAAILGKAAADRWTEGGHREHSDRLRMRGNLHTYRPWAYMIGRRGCAEVMTELIDGQALPGGARSISLDLMIDEAASWIPPLPLNETTPMPWRDPDNKDYPSSDWCSEAPDAAHAYGTQFSNNNVLAEHSSWRWLGWGVPEEDRWIRTRHGHRTASSLIAPAAGSVWEITVDVASRYPALRDLTWADRELVVQGRGLYSDAERMEWLSLHPAAARELNWTPGHSQFEWVRRRRFVARPYGLAGSRTTKPQAAVGFRVRRGVASRPE
ncbi:hypothetical protein [Nocardioides sp. KR10-350]|uniref:hypothetical protein n=1 Tax=Nocardioides cheoyonin TaxID=3156615 RepID=UPI0032B570CD